MSAPNTRRLAACPSCALQFDATGHDPGSRFHCACGELVEVSTALPHDAAVVRCSSCGGPREEGSAACSFCSADFTLHERDLETVCPSCMSRIANRARYCHSCGVAIAPQGTVGRLTQSVCPACEGERKLYSRHVEGSITVLECDRCVGVWVGNQIFRLLEERAATGATTLLAPPLAARVPVGAPVDTPVAGPVSASSGGFYRACVTCGGLMQRRNYGRRSGVIVDVCHQHGLWFDAGELENILRWLRDGGGVTQTVPPAPRRSADWSPSPYAGTRRRYTLADGAFDFVTLLLDGLVEYLIDR